MKDQLKQFVLSCQRCILQSGSDTEKHDGNEQCEVLNMDFLVDTNTDVASNDECDYGKTKQGSCDPLKQHQSSEDQLDWVVGP